ncbi:MAG: hypothetical protein L6R41_004323 [Letrouitia leprolyta]|nr:MAG: hypothetical protein L6R41_004323 [Letrouitia leprolyta]
MSNASPDAADLDPGAIGFETADVNHITATEEMSAHMAERPLKPPPPPKKAHLDEVIRLMKELEELREEKAQAEEMTDLMAQDLQVAQEDVERKDEELRKKGVELISCGEELKNWQQQAQNLANEVQEEKRLTAEMKQSIEMQEIPVTSRSENGSEEVVRLRDQVANLIASLATKDREKQEAASQTEEELSYLRRQVDELTSSLAKKEDQMKSIGSRTMKELVYLRKQATQLKSTISEKDAELTTKVSLAAGAAYDKWQPIIREKQLQYETTLRETEERLNAQLAHEQELRQTTEATLQATREEMRTASSQGPTQDQQLQFETTLRELEQRLQAQLAQEQEQRRIAEETLHAAQEKMNMLDTQSCQQEQQLRQAAEASLRAAQEALQTQSRETSERTATLQKRAQDAEASLQEHANRVKEATIYHEELLRRTHDLETEAQNQRKACEYFKRNSERLSREIKEADAARRLLEQSEYTGKRQVADLRAQVATLQQGRRSVPGGF